MAGKKSDVWKYFVIQSNEDTKATCTFCHAKISRGGANTRAFTTSNMKKHLDSVHSRDMKIMNLEKEPRTCFENAQTCVPGTSGMQINVSGASQLSYANNSSKSNEDCSLLPSQSSSTMTIPIYSQSKPKFHKINDMFVKQTPLSTCSSKHIQITELIGKMICCDILPFRIVESEGFNDLISFLEPRYKIPDRTTFSRTVIPELYQRVQSRVKGGFIGVEHVSLTSDLWSTHACDDFISLTAHFVDNNFEHRSLCLEVLPFSLAKHTADSIATILKESVELWELNGKVHAVVTDNAGNMINGVAKANYHHVPCTAHTLQLVIKETFFSQRNISDTCAKARRIVAHFKHSISSSKLLKNFQKNHNMPVHRLIQDEPTRWNSTYLMLERLIEQRRAITWLTPEISIHTELTSSEWSLLEHAVNTLKSFYIATLNISNENVTVAEIIPTVNGLKSELTTLTEQQHSGLKGVQTDMIHSLCSRFRSIETNNVFAIATLLDPRFKKTVFAEPHACASATQHLIEEIREYQCTPPANTSCGISTDEEQDSKKLKGMLSIYSNIINKTSIPSTYRCPEAEVEMYLAEPPIPINSNPLQYWKTSPHTRLCKAAQKYLSTPAGSVASERLFSSAGLISSKKRSSLNPEKLRQLVFLNKNVYILKSCK